jgi:hypothetical protein
MVATLFLFLLRALHQSQLLRPLARQLDGQARPPISGQQDRGKSLELESLQLDIHIAVFIEEFVVDVITPSGALVDVLPQGLFGAHSRPPNMTCPGSPRRAPPSLYSRGFARPGRCSGSARDDDASSSHKFQSSAGTVFMTSPTILALPVI